MGQTPRALQPSVSERHFFGAELRRLRERASLSQARLGTVIRFSADLVRRVETADRFPPGGLSRPATRHWRPTGP
ncbi:helix-turn-helix domain-containing protein [Micromonospora sp. NPDC050276]|uniref:helix-turn-helix domain-containing protein n=1 Tax=Micromonospora sp. NPDC050276 TaxID=3364278 RepID=UPI0037B8379D